MVVIPFTFKRALQLTEELRRPFYFASRTFKDQLDRLDPQDRLIAKASLAFFKEQKTFSPGDFVHRLNDHKMGGPLGEFYDAHLIHGKWVLIYHHSGELIILLDLVKHDMVESKKAPVLARFIIQMFRNEWPQARAALERAKKFDLSKRR